MDEGQKERQRLQTHGCGNRRRKQLQDFQGLVQQLVRSREKIGRSLERVFAIDTTLVLHKVTISRAFVVFRRFERGENGSQEARTWPEKSLPFLHQGWLPPAGVCGL